MIEKSKDYLPDPDGRAEEIGAEFLRASKIVLTDRSFEDYWGICRFSLNSWAREF